MKKLPLPSSVPPSASAGPGNGAIARVLTLVTVGLLSVGCNNSSAGKSEPAASVPEAEPGAAGAHGSHDHDTTTPATGPSATPSEAKWTNPVQHEMQLLAIAMRTSLDAIANDQLAAIPAAIAEVHPAKSKTEAALEAGSYRPPHNADKMAEFARLDGQFHERLVALVSAAKQNDARAAAAAYGLLVRGCVDCHSTYRFGR